MGLLTVQYSFEQPFPFSAARAFAWCTDFEPEDTQYMSGRARRVVRPLSADLILLKDTRFPVGLPPVVKTRLVRIRSSERAWTNTHFSGPNRYSQFWYRVVPDGRNTSHLEYTALHVERFEGRTPPAATFTKRLARGDAATWRAIAKGMIKDLGQRSP